MATPTYPNAIITRNDEGIPRIVANTMVQAVEAYGYIQTVDRPFQIFVNYKAANGQLASIFGRGPITPANPQGQFLTQDIAVLSTKYTDADLLAQYAQWPEEVRTLHEAYLRGVNARFQEIIDGDVPVPTQFTLLAVQPQTFTLAESLNFIYLLLRQNSSNTAPNLLFQLNNLLRLLELKAINPVYGEALFADLEGVNGVTRARWTLAEGDACGSVGEQTVEAATPRPLCGSTSATPDLCKCIAAFAAGQEEIDRTLLEHGVTIKLGSRSAVLGPQKVVGNGTLGAGGAQAGQGAPSPSYLAILDTPGWNTDGLGVVAGSIFWLSPCHTRGCYSYNYYLQVGNFHSRDLSIEPRTNAVPYATYSIQIRGESPLVVVAAHSTTTGFVLGSFPVIPGYMIVERNPFLFRDFVSAGILADRLALAQNFSEILSYIPAETADIFGNVVIFHDGTGNIGAIHMGVRTRLPDIVNRKLPQVDSSIASLLIDNPIVPIEQYEVIQPASTINDQPYYAYWNGAFFPVQETYIYNSYEYNRVNWIYLLLDRYGSLRYEDLRELLILMGDSKLMQSGNAMENEPLPVSTLNNQTDAFVIMRDCLYEKVLRVPTPQRLQLLQLLQEYDGRWIGGTLENTVTSLDVLDRWMLANTWIANMIQNILGPLYPNLLVPPTVPWMAVPLALIPAFTSLLIRILCNPCNNPIFYPFYPQGTALDNLVAESLDQAFTELNATYGDRPWGEGLRRLYTFTNQFLGPVAQIPYLQHGSHETRSDIRIQGFINRGHIFAPGVTENIVLTPQGAAPGPLFTNLVEDFQFFNFIEFGPKLMPLSCLANKCPPVQIPFGGQCCTPASAKPTNPCFICPQ